MDRGDKRRSNYYYRAVKAEVVMTKISCVICAYNEADRIRHVLDVVATHPLFDEVIVVDDGSTDETNRVLCSYPALHLISYEKNRGKTYALS